MPGGLTVAELSADLGLNAAPLTSGLQGIMGKFGAIPPVAGVAGVAIAAGLAVGVKKAFDLGEAFDEAYDTIRIGTGATGEALSGLEGDFKATLKNVPSDMGDVSTAIADLNTRLGITGKPLQDLSKQFLDLSRVTGTDLKTNIHDMTRVFGDWGIKTKDQSGALDKMFRASQSSGVAIDELSGSVVQFGAPLRNLGFSFDESLALFSQFDKAGVNTETVFAGLKMGVGKLAKEGEAVPETFGRIVDQITKLGPGTEATSLAIELFGQRAGPDMADAITGGKFAIDDMLAAITGGKDTIGAAAKDTDDWRESLALLKNKALVALEPVLKGVFDGINWVIKGFVKLTENKQVQAFMSGLGDVFREFADTVRSVVDRVRDNWDVIGPIIMTPLKVARQYVKMAMKIIGNLMGAAMALIRGDWGDAWNHVKGIVRSAWDGIKSIVRTGVNGLKSIVSGLGKKILGWIGDLGGLLKDAGRSLIQGLINGIKAKAGDIVSTIKEYVTDKIPGFVKNALGIGSPSKVFYGFGVNLMQGLALGISDETSLIDRALAGIAGNIALDVAPQVGFGGAAATSAATMPRGGPTYVNVYLDSEPVAARIELRQAEKVRRATRPMGAW